MLLTPPIPEPDNDLVRTLLSSPYNAHRIHSLSGLASLYLNSLDFARILSDKYPNGSHNEDINRMLATANSAKQSLLSIKSLNSKTAADSIAQKFHSIGMDASIKSLRQIQYFLPEDHCSP